VALAGPAAREREARAGGDGGERLAAEAERRGALQVLERGDLARREAREGERQVLRRDPAAAERAPASRLFSTSSLSAEAGRSTTSPAAIWFTRSSGRARIRPMGGGRGMGKRRSREILCC